MPGPGPHMLYTFGVGQSLSAVSGGRFTAHHCVVYAVNAFFGPDLGSFSQWLASVLGSGGEFAGRVETLVHHPFYYPLILGLPLSLLYGFLSKFLLRKGFLDSASGVPLTQKQCLLLITAGSLSHFFLDHLFEENGKSSMYTWILSTGWWDPDFPAPINPDAVIVVAFLCTILICGFIYINRPKIGRKVSFNPRGQSSHVCILYKTAYVAPSSRVFGRGELVTDPKKITMHYLKTDFFIDLAAALPLPQIVIWFVSPAVQNPTAAHSNHTISLIIFLQYVPRLFVMFPLNNHIIKSTGVVAKTAWAGAAYNLLLYLLAAHVLGASWYLLSIERQYSCWRLECRKEYNSTHTPSCNPMFLDCKTLGVPERDFWALNTNVLNECDPRGHRGFHFGIFADAFTEQVAAAEFVEKYFYCLWWGMRNLCSYGQNLETSTYVGETLFSSLICLAGLVLFAQLIGNMQSYLASTTARLEEWRVKRRDTEEWMRHRQLPPNLQERVRRFVQYKWLATRGVDEEDILRALPLDTRREIQRHLCLALVRRVPFFSQMDNQLLDAICERLISSLSTKESFLVREDDPVNEMLFIIRGQLESSTTNGGRSGFYNSITLKPGDFCGEELLTWALMPSPTLNLPLSTRTVKSLTEVEAFALRAEDLKFVANQFKRLHSKRLQHAFRYYSHQWRTWGACFMQAAWRRHKRRKLAEELAEIEYGGDDSSATDGDRQHMGATVFASESKANSKRVARTVTFVEPSSNTLAMPKKLFKPDEPDFSAD